MATSSYITKTDLQKNNAVLLGLLGERDTRISQNELDIASIQMQIDGLEVGLHYVGEAIVIPTNPENGAMYWFDVPAIGSDPEMKGYYFYVAKNDEWKKLVDGGTTIEVATDADMLKVIFNE